MSKQTDELLDNLLIDLVYLIKGYDHDQDCTELDRSAVNRTKTEILRLSTKQCEAARRSELADAFREFSKDVAFDRRLAYYDDRITALQGSKNSEAVAYDKSSFPPEADSEKGGLSA